MTDATLNEEIARLEIEIDGVRDALDEAIKRNEALEAEIERLRMLHATDLCELQRHLDTIRETARAAMESAMKDCEADESRWAWETLRAALKSMEPAP